MSGGYFNYADQNVAFTLQDMTNAEEHAEFRRRFPRLNAAVLALGDWMHAALHPVDLQLSGDAALLKEGRVEVTDAQFEDWVLELLQTKIKEAAALPRP